MHVFWTHGYESSSLALLKDAMGGISSPSFYAAFASKAALFEEVLQRYLATYGTVTAVLEDPSVPPRDAVESALRASARMQTDPSHPPGCLLVISATTTPEDATGPQSILAQDRSFTRGGFASCIRRAIFAGELPDSIDVEGHALMLDTFIRGLTAQARDGASSLALEAAIDCALQWWKDSGRTSRKKGQRN
jgi:AcrR family transcriptional regulator